MATFIGFSTIGADKPRTVNPLPVSATGVNNGITDPTVFGKKFKLLDEKLVIQDFINALNIRKGEKVGQPSYGTTIWDFVFEPNTADVSTALQNEIQRVASEDSRLNINTIRSFQREEGILVEVQLSINPFNNVGDIAVVLDPDTNSATLSF